jgi:hypothetical protein
MPKIHFDALDSISRRAVFWLADEAETLPTFVIESASHPGEILEAVAFMREQPRGSAPHALLAARLQLGDKSAESILACIKRAAPTYQSMTERADDELDELLADLNGTSGA